jgi:transcriptional regulator with XRE-family HTH domain
MGERITIKQAAERSGLSRGMLSRLLKAGRIQGKKVKMELADIEVWLVDAESLAAYPASRQKPGTRPGTKRKPRDTGMGDGGHSSPV